VLWLGVCCYDVTRRKNYKVINVLKKVLINSRFFSSVLLPMKSKFSFSSSSSFILKGTRKCLIFQL
jgi:hypothetical protein